MMDFKPVQVRMGRPRPVLAAAPLNVEPPPMPDFLFTGYTGVPGIVETAAMLAVSVTATWVSISAALDKKSPAAIKVAGWVGGVGSALLGAFYLGAKTGLNDLIGLPAVRISPD